MKWKLAQVVDEPRKRELAGEARDLLERLQRAKRLAPDRARLLAAIRRSPTP